MFKNKNIFLHRKKTNKSWTLFIILSTLAVLFLILIFSFGKRVLIKTGELLGVYTRPSVEKVVVLKAEENIKIIEGWDNSKIINYLQGFSQWQEADFVSVVGQRNIDNSKEQNLSYDWSEDFDFLATKPKNLSLEGYLFPDTYRVFASSSPQDIVSRLLQNFEDKLTPEMLQEIKRQGKTIHEIITMASIIEKEAPLFNQTHEQDAKIISGIFWNRLNIGMALQSDATLSYIFEDNKPAHSGAELKVDSPYNSYLYRGLPPGPICNPGLISIKAAIYPAETDYFYFLTPLDGSRVYYAKSYQEHLNNKYKYLK